jgi:hypothetical protein
MIQQARLYKGIDHQDVRAAIKKQFGTIVEFHRVYALPASGVHDILRGRASARVEAVVDEILAKERESTNVDSTADSATQHLNAEAE